MTVQDLVMKKNYDIKYYDQNMKVELKESALLNFLQDIATLSAESFGFGPTFVFSNNYAWFLLKYHIELNASTKHMDSITLTTEPRGTNRLFAYRNFGIYNPAGEKIGSASSMWALIDMKDKKMLSVDKILDGLMPKYSKREDDLDFEKIPPCENVLYSKEFEVRYDDIDVNQHANNSNYMVWALETLPAEYRNNKNIRIFDINYKKECSYGTRILSEVCIPDDNTTIHILKDADSKEELCLLKLIWRDVY